LLIDIDPLHGSTMNALTLLASLPVWAQHLVAWIGLIVAILTQLSLLLHAVGAVFGASPITKAAGWVDHGAIALVAFAKQLAAIFPAKDAAKIAGSTLLVVLVFVLGCTPARTAASERAAADIASCVLEHADLKPEAIAAACAGIAAEDAVKIVLAAKRNAPKIGAPAPACASSSVSK
jgi:hypothetical protein